MKKIIVIGGGIVGSSCAYYLSKNPNNNITLIDYGIGQATKASAGIICPWLSQRRNKKWYELVKEGANFYNILMQDLKKDGIQELPFQQNGTYVFKKTEKLSEKLLQIALEKQKDAPMLKSVTLVKHSPYHFINTTESAVFTSGGGRLDGGKLVEILKQLFINNGGIFIEGKAHLTQNKIIVKEKIYEYDQIVLACGAWLNEILPDYDVDIYPQKGQLFEINVDFKTDELPCFLLHGEIDLIPFPNNKIIVGATHENDMGFDLNIDNEKIKNMQLFAKQYFPTIQSYPISNYRSGTRAYTSDFTPFFGKLENNIFVTSGLGSSGLTSGAYIGYLLSQILSEEKITFNIEAYTPKNYITKN